MTRPASSDRAPRRIVLLVDDETSAIAEVLAEYTPEQVSGTRLHTDLRRLAAEHAPRTVAAEWLSSLGWRRFLWSSK